MGSGVLRELWGDVPTIMVTAKQWGEILTKYPIAADIKCDGSIKGYQAPGQPGALVFRHRNGKMFRHYVDHPKWLAATAAGDLINITDQELRKTGS